MGVDIHVYMGYKENSVRLYKPASGFQEIPIWQGRNSEFFDYLREHSYSIDLSLPVPDSIREDLKEWEGEGFGFGRMTLADIKLRILLNEYEQQYERNEENEEVYELLKEFYEAAYAYFNFWNSDVFFNVSLSDITLYFWFDH